MVGMVISMLPKYLSSKWFVTETSNDITFCFTITGLRWACLCAGGLVAIGSALRCISDDPYAAKW